MIELQDVTIERSGRMLCQGLSWQLPDPGAYLLLGSNGSGKTLLCHLLSGRLRPSQGRVVIDGRPVYGRMGVQCDCWYSHAEAALRADEPVGDYLEQELLNAGGTTSVLTEVWPLLELKLGGRRRRLSQLSHGEALLAEVALAACVPQRLVILDGHLSYLDPALGQAAAQLIQAGGALRNERFILLTAARLIDHGLVWREMFALDGGMPLNIISLDWKPAPESSMEQAGRRLVLYPAGMGAAWQLAGGGSFAVTGVRDGGGWQVKLLGSFEQMIEELRDQGIVLARLEWDAPSPK